MQALKGYLEQLQAVAQQPHATGELSYHGALERLLRTLRPDLTLVHEPTRTVVGRPDFAILHQHAPIGYVEAEAYAADLDSLPPHARAQTDAFRQHLENFLLFQSSPARGSGCNTQHASSPMPSLSCFNPHPPVGAGATIYTHGNDVCWCEFSGLFGTVSCEFNSRLFAYLAISVPHLGTRESISEATQPTVHRSRHTGRLCEVHSLRRVAD
jgi:hypothetical protein